MRKKEMKKGRKAERQKGRERKKGRKEERKKENGGKNDLQKSFNSPKSFAMWSINAKFQVLTIIRLWGVG